MSRTQRLVGWVACMTVAICSVGVPLPARSERKAGDTPFPCQDCPCGCGDAETCWRECCCYTNQQKVAWARKHGVAVPAFVVAAAKREGCCDAKSARGCCETKSARVRQAGKKPACCARREAACAAPASQGCASGACARCDGPSTCETTTAAAEQRRSPSPVLLISKLRCQGISLSVSMLPPSVVVKASDFCWDLDERYEPFVFSVNLYQPPYLAVAAPPPDACCA